MLPGEVFLWLLLLHVLPKGFLHYNSQRTLRLLYLLPSAQRIGQDLPSAGFALRGASFLSTAMRSSELRQPDTH